MVSIPDGLGPGDDRKDFAKVIHGILNVMPGCLEELIRKINDDDESGNKITCIIADQGMAWAFEVAKKMGLRWAAYYPASAALLATNLSIPKLIQDGTINADGVVKKAEMIQLSPGMPPIHTDYFAWNCMNGPKTGQIIFNYYLITVQATQIADLIICNSFDHIEQPVFASAPNIIPLGPLITSLRGIGKHADDFWPKDTACTAWLDEQPANSVVYVAFGSITVFDQRQFQELALELELTGRRFLWVLRADLMDERDDAYPDGFR